MLDVGCYHPGMNASDFNFDLPAECIAIHPARPRDAARMLVVQPPAPHGDHGVRDLPAFLRPGDVLVFNNTRVIPARLHGRRGAVKIELTLHKAESRERWRAFARPGKRLRVGDRVDIAPEFRAWIEAKGDGGEITLRLDADDGDPWAALHRHGIMPLPPYIRRDQGAVVSDAADYQTLFAAVEGAVAAPTAGLHFTPELLAALHAREVRTAAITLHVGAGTFLPVKSEDLSQHHMHAEWGSIPADSAATITAARAAGGRVVAVGTTSLRLLESAAAEDGSLGPFAGDTSLFILPGYRFKLTDLLLTNFHLPRSTLFMLVCAFAGTETMKAAYGHAITTGYRFYSYGDCCLLDRYAEKFPEVSSSNPGNRLADITTPPGCPAPPPGLTGW
ncbi:S-adenosylmethionine:tRNA ribosyltransferase-isomerase [uncultured Gammaproteobacteria bacterium]